MLANNLDLAEGIANNVLCSSITLWSLLSELESDGSTSDEMFSVDSSSPESSSSQVSVSAICPDLNKP